MGWGRVQAICDFVHNLISFGYEHAILSIFFFFNYTAPTEIYPLSLHDALPIYGAGIFADGGNNLIGNPTGTSGVFHGVNRSEEYTSELQSPCNLVCRLLLE